MRKEDLLADDDGSFPVPLQIEKVFNGEEHPTFNDGWKNLMVFGDNLQFLKTIYKNEDLIIKDKIKGKVKLVYIDPPLLPQMIFKAKKVRKPIQTRKRGLNLLNIFAND
ncbi:MAG: hypothetical protein V8R55_04515 [Dysosmobacter sp.]